jgi:hypothetical protein
VLLKPAYWLVETIARHARKRAAAWFALRLGLVTIAQMLEALVQAVEHPAIGVRVLDVPALRGGGRGGG